MRRVFYAQRPRLIERGTDFRSCHAPSGSQGRAGRSRPPRPDRLSGSVCPFRPDVVNDRISDQGGIGLYRGIMWDLTSKRSQEISSSKNAFLLHDPGGFGGGRVDRSRHGTCLLSVPRRRAAAESSSRLIRSPEHLLAGHRTFSAVWAVERRLGDIMSHCDIMPDRSGEASDDPIRRRAPLGRALPIPERAAGVVAAGTPQPPRMYPRSIGTASNGGIAARPASGPLAVRSATIR
jgi:hypothetical protein